MELGRFKGKLEDLTELLGVMSELPSRLRFYVETEYVGAGEYRGSIKTRLRPKTYKRKSGGMPLDDVIRTCSDWTYREIVKVGLEPLFGGEK